MAEDRPESSVPTGASGGRQSEFPDSVGGRVAFYRERAGLTQAELSRVTGLSQSTISLIEGGGNPRADTLQTIAAALGVRVADLFGERSEGLAEVPPEDAVFFRDFQSLPRELQDQMRAFLRLVRSQEWPKK